MGEASTEKISLKLLIDRNDKRVIFGEAGKDFVDFLFQFIYLPVGTVVKLLSKDKMIGSLGNIYKSIEEMPAKYMQPDVKKEYVLEASDTSKVFDQFDGDNDTEYDGDDTYNEYHEECVENAEEQPINSEFFYRCRNGCAYMSKNSQVPCTTCGRLSMNVEMKYIESPENEEADEIEEGGGYVKELVNYMIMDNLVVKPMSTISSFTLLSNVKDMRAVECLEVYIRKNEAVNLLKASFVTDKVLSSVFAGYQKI